MTIQQHVTRESPARAADWREGLPVLEDGLVTLRQLERRDAASLLRHVSKPSVLEHLAPGPSTVEEFGRFIDWTHARRRAGSQACFGIVPAGQVRPVGFFQVWSITQDFSTAEWGCVFDDDYWGRGLFEASAHRALEFGINVLGIRRFEARVAVPNRQANSAFLKLGAKNEGILRRCFPCASGIPTDHVMWSILAEEFRA